MAKPVLDNYAALQNTKPKSAWGSWTECSKQRVAKGAHGETGAQGWCLVIAGHTSNDGA